MKDSNVGAPNRRDAAAVSATFLASSAMGFALLVLVARWLTPAQNAVFLALWGLLFAFGSLLGAMEQEVVRTAAQASLEHRRVPRVAIQTVTATMLPALLVLGILVATPTGRSLLDRSVVVSLLTLVAVGGFAAQVLSRAIFLGVHDLRRYIGVLLGEAVIRLALAIVLVAAAVLPSSTILALIIVAGCFSWVPVVRAVARRIDWHSPLMPWRRVAGTVAALALANGFASLVLTGFPAVATFVIDDRGGLADLFAVITVSRVPLVLLAPVLALAVPVAVRWLHLGQSGRLGRMLAWVALASLVAAGVTGLAGYEFGPFVMRLTFGPQYHPSRLMCAAVIAAACVMAAALLQVAILVALQRYWRITASWAVALTAAIASMAWWPGSSAERGVSGFVSASALAAIATGLALHGERTAPGETPARA